MAGTQPTASSQFLSSEDGGVRLLERQRASAAPIAPASTAGHHEAIYAAAAGDISKVPWADARPNPALVCWLNAEAPGVIRPGARVAVVGCGLGDDVAELTARGFDALGFDISATAVDWARRRFPEQAASFVAADLLDPPSRFRHRFDLVVEVNTLQSLHPSEREEAAVALATLASPRGVVLAVCRARDESQLLDEIDGPPWPLAPSEFTGLMEAAGLRPLRSIDDFLDDEIPPVRRLRGAFVHA